MAFVVWILWRLATRYDKSGWWTFGWFLVLSGIERFLVEFVRINPVWFWRAHPAAVGEHREHRASASRSSPCSASEPAVVVGDAAQPSRAETRRAARAS